MMTIFDEQEFLRIEGAGRMFVAYAVAYHRTSISLSLYHEIIINYDSTMSQKSYSVFDLLTRSDSESIVCSV